LTECFFRLTRRFASLVVATALAFAATAHAADEFKSSWAVAPDGTRLAVREYGNPQGPAIVFVHGIAQSQLAFQRQVKSDLPKKYRLITYDLRGHGESDKPAQESAYADGQRMSDDVRAVLSATGAARPVLVGWSLGGIIVAQYLNDHGDTGIAGVNFVGARIAKPATQPARMPGAAHIRDMLSIDLERNIRATSAFVRACVAAPLEPADFELMLGYNMASTVVARAATLKWSGGTDFVALFARLKVPVLITQGRRDQVISSEVAMEAGRIIKTSKISWYEASGHSPFFEDPSRFNAELAAFADEVLKK
jgi:pimeloyl-ACP methyl ester carboxylesterase